MRQAILLSILAFILGLFLGVRCFRGTLTLITGNKRLNLPISRHVIIRVEGKGKFDIDTGIK